MHESACIRIAAAMVLRALKDTQSKDDDLAASASDWLTGPDSDLYLNVLDLNKGKLPRVLGALQCVPFRQLAAQGRGESFLYLLNAPLI